MMVNLLVALLVIVLTALVLIATLYILRRVRRERKERQFSQLPTYNEKRLPNNHNPRRLTITASPYSGGKRTESILVIQEKQNLIANSNSPPPSPIPEIHITFPDEVDENTGKSQSGRVVVVRVGERGSVGMEPVQTSSTTTQEHGLPRYEERDSGRFQSLDLDRMGGLKEKETQFA